MADKDEELKKDDEKDVDLDDKEQEKDSNKDEPVQFKKKLSEERAAEVLAKWKPVFKTLNEAYTEQDWFKVLKANGWKNEADDFWSKSFDGIRLGGEMNPRGTAKVIIKPKNRKLVATYGDTVFGMVDPRYTDPSKGVKEFEANILKALKAKYK